MCDHEQVDCDFVLIFLLPCLCFNKQHVIGLHLQVFLFWAEKLSGSPSFRPIDFSAGPKLPVRLGCFDWLQLTRWMGDRSGRMRRKKRNNAVPFQCWTVHSRTTKCAVLSWKVRFKSFLEWSNSAGESISTTFCKVGEPPLKVQTWASVKWFWFLHRIHTYATQPH